VFVSYDQTWMDQDSSWWAKANRAKEHIDSLRRQVDEYRASAPYSLTSEPTEKPDRLAYRLRFSKQVPVRITTTVGDVLHNLRAALESLAFEVARRGQGGTLTAKQEKESTFPICKSPEEFDAFFKGKKGLLYDRRARAALRSVQPFVNLEAAHRLGVALDRSFEETFRWSELHRLDTLWNIDKHRRLTLMAWRPDLIYWGSNGPSNRRALPGEGTLANGSILVYIEGSDEGQSDKLNYEFNLVLTDDPAGSLDEGAADDVVDLLEHWHQHIVNLVVFPGCSRSCHRPPCRLTASSRQVAVEDQSGDAASRLLIRRRILRASQNNAHARGTCPSRARSLARSARLWATCGWSPWYSR